MHRTEQRLPTQSIALILSRCPAADTGEQEAEMEWLALQLNQLTPEEFAIVEKQK